MSDWSRRNFLRGAAGGLGMVVIPTFLTRSGNLFASPTPGIATPAKNLNATYFATSFGVDEQVIRKAMTAALSKGGEFADLFFQHQINNYVGLEDGSVNRAYSSVDLGVGVRVVVGDQTGFAFTEELTPESIIEAAKTAATIAQGSARAIPDAFKVAGRNNYYPIETAWEEIGIDQKIPFLDRINSRIFAADTRVKKASINFSDGTGRILIVNSDGLAVEDYQPSSSIGASCVAEQDGRRERNGYNLAGRRDIHSYGDHEITEIADMAVTRTVKLFEAVQPPAGEMPVVLGPGGSGVLLHEAIGHGMEADFNRKGISIYAEMIGRNVAKDFVTVVDDGTHPHERGSINVDDEGNPSERTVLVENGVLRSYMHDRISAKHYGVAPTGSGRRQSFRHTIMPRMRNTYMENGPHDPMEIIKSVSKGIYCEEFTNGQVQIGAGDFSFYVSSGYLIEDGKLTAPIKDVNLIGNGPKALENVSMVGNDLKIAVGGWTCGKNGQSVPVSQGMPTVRIDGSVTVGGVEGGAQG
ncbi:MAG: TldD/PmbA family protein [Candidatus Eisenbacteria bacterium]|uniref:TldD/PmbA family protein n=1 Tax=Eiseniibacteriota bacterium TaxID=2212470 RepID=A0A956SEB6_UNCEI|nr:TldD/PmbA family protein [Candidatus Eisenbacteria bacterium]MCB9464964.1 TldD/PmbA family protein [Candidatus Eisenbacteria bacterium]